MPERRHGDVLDQLGASLGVLETSSRRCEASWDVLGLLGASWGRFGGILGRLGGVLEASWGRLGASWGRLGASWERLGSVLVCLGDILGRLDFPRQTPSKCGLLCHWCAR